MPMTAFIGVRISWLIVARKALWPTLAASAPAASLASRGTAARSGSAITAWSPKVRSSASSFVAERAGGWRVAHMVPIARPSQIIGDQTTEQLPIRSRRRAPFGGRASTPRRRG